MPLSDSPPALFLGDCLERMSVMDADVIDAVVTDPPYGLAFMGKDWDHGLPGVAFWTAALRIAKPGAYLLAFGGTRTFHRLTCAIEDAGWEIRDCLSWLYGSGFPKSLNGPWGGTALKPAWEPIVMARKPLIGTVAKNVQRYGTGGINVDGCRISGEPWRRDNTRGRSEMYDGWGMKPNIKQNDSGGRWPANLCLDEAAAAMLDEQSGERPAGVAVRRHGMSAASIWGSGKTDPADDMGYPDSGGASRFFYVAKASRSEREEGLEGEGVTGAAAVDRKEGTAGLQSPRAGAGRTADHVRNHHPTVKPVSLMRWLVRLVTPPGGTVLDPFMGSGTTGIAAHMESCRFVGIEKEREYFDIANQRIAHWSKQGGLI